MYSGFNWNKRCIKLREIYQSLYQYLTREMDSFRNVCNSDPSDNVLLPFQSSMIQRLPKIVFEMIAFFPVNLTLIFALELEEVHKAMQF